MLHVTYLDHSGFLVETPSAYLLFDWWKGTLPPMDGKPLYVFASHSHHDHFTPAIFALQATFILADDIALTPSRREKWGVAPEATIYTMGGNAQRTIDNFVVETLPSTDEGVAFLVTIDGTTLYHAGDLNWWHWDGEPDPWNPTMEQTFQAYIAPLKGRTLHLAMVPLDGRLQYAQDWGLCHLLQLAKVQAVIPMHQWGDPTPTQTFCTQHPQWAPLMHPLTTSGQSLSL